jgi:tetratricopeptide (TPR) repeat protein
LEVIAALASSNTQHQGTQMSFLKRLFGGRPDADAFFIRGATKRTKGDLDGAIADFTKVIELKPDFMAVYINRGIAKQAKRDLDGAIADFTKAIELQPDNVAAYVCRGSAKHAKGDFDSAIEDYTKAIELKPDLSDAYQVRALAKRDKGDLDSAISDYTKAIGSRQLQCPTCGTTYRLGEDATMVSHQDMADLAQSSGATIISRDGRPIAGKAWAPVATQTRPVLIGRKRNEDHPTKAEVLEDLTGLLENVRRIRATIEDGGKAFWYCECPKDKQPHEFPSDF